MVNPWETVSVCIYIYIYTCIYIWGLKTTLLSGCCWNYPSGMSSGKPHFSFRDPSGTRWFWDISYFSWKSQSTSATCIHIYIYIYCFFLRGAATPPDPPTKDWRSILYLQPWILEILKQCLLGILEILNSWILESLMCWRMNLSDAWNEQQPE